MATDLTASEPDAADTPAAPARIWPAVALVAAYWIAHVSIGFMDIANSRKFFYRLLPLLIVVLSFGGWWLLNRRIRWGERLTVLAGAIVIALGFLLLRDPSVRGPLAIGASSIALRWMVTGWALWLLVTRTASPAARQWGMLAVAVLAWAWIAGVRMEGLGGQGEVVFYPRWTPSSEEQFLATQASAKERPAEPPAQQEPLIATAADWPEFRGARRDGAVTGVKIRTDWNEKPPAQAWKRRIGPGWSSITVVGDRLFTQEQRGDREAVVCCAADTGAEIWSHENEGRFDESMGGVGPRATPTFADGKIFALGATGVLNCLDAGAGTLHWSRDITKDGQGGAPYWGFCSSPLVVDGKVIVFAGRGRQEESEDEAPENADAPPEPEPGARTNPDTLIAYDAASGEVAWRAAAGDVSYSSPQLVELKGERQVLFLSDAALNAFDPATGELLWSVATDAKDGAPSIQPHWLGGDEFLATFNGENGMMKLAVSREGDAWQAVAQGPNRGIKPFFNDLVRVGDDLYGFDGEIFCCVDARTGKRNWKKGRYGSGQVLLLADQPVLVVISEEGAAVLLEANPEEHQELGRFQAIEGKTWNHPTIVRGRLYVRNAQEMACYEL